MYSLTYTGAVVMVLSYLAKIAGIEVGNEEFSKSIEGVVFLIGFFVTLYGRIS